MEIKDQKLKLIKDTIGELKNVLDVLEYRKNSLFENSLDVQRYTYITKFPDVIDYIETSKRIDSIKELLAHEKTAYQECLVDNCNHPISVLEDIVDDKWICKCAICKKYIGNDSTKFKGTSIITPYFYRYNIPIDDIRDEYIALCEEGCKNPTSIIVRRYNTVDGKHLIKKTR